MYWETHNEKIYKSNLELWVKHMKKDSVTLRLTMEDRRQRIGKRIKDRMGLVLVFKSSNI